MDNLQKLKEIIGEYKSAVIAFSGGVDSTYLAAVAKEVLGDSLLLVTSASSTYPAFEMEEAKELAAMLKCKHRIVISEELDIPGFSDNPPDRCYHCKKALFSLITELAQKEGFDAVFDGSNSDDLNDYRPGRRAVKELAVRSPLLEAGLGKKEIRELSKNMGLPTATKPSFACLASRFPYGEEITPTKLSRVDKAEAALRDMGYGQFRVRSHGDLARIELADSEIDRGWKDRSVLESACKKAGFTFVAIDCKGYRTGAMNESLEIK